MGNLEISRHVGQGDIVIRRGNKIQRKRVSGGLPMYGIWENGHARVTISPDDERVITPMPRGIVQQGAVEVKAKEDLDGGQDEQGNTGAGTHKPGGMPKVRH